MAGLAIAAGIVRARWEPFRHACGGQVLDHVLTGLIGIQDLAQEQGAELT